LASIFAELKKLMEKMILFGVRFTVFGVIDKKNCLLSDLIVF
jgi:hypothetical protein